MKGLTIRQPWAHFIASGHKRIENRDWRPPADLIGQHLAIHASKKFEKSAAEWIKTELGLTVPKHDDLPQGAIVAVAIVDRVCDSSDESEGWDDPWFIGAYGWILRDVVAIEPVP